MDINIKKMRECQFGCLKVGRVFRIDDRYYIKISNIYVRDECRDKLFNALCIKDLDSTDETNEYILYNIQDEQIVIFVDAELNIYDY